MTKKEVIKHVASKLSCILDAMNKTEGEEKERFSQAYSVLKDLARNMNLNEMQLNDEMMKDYNKRSAIK